MGDIQAQRQGGVGRDGRDLRAGVEQEVQMTERLPVAADAHVVLEG